MIYSNRMKTFLDSATDPKQYDSKDLHWEKDGSADSPSRKYFQSFLSPILEVQDKAVLDIGCGLGQLFPFLAQHGAARIVGLEPSERNFEYASRHYPEYQVVKTTLEDYHPGEKFDVAVSIMVFEHIKDVEASFRKIITLLKPHGHFYLITADKDYALKPRFGYEIGIENISDDVAVAKTKRSFGTLYDIYRSTEFYIQCAKDAGFVDAEYQPLIPNETHLEYMPHLKDHIGVATSHLLVFKAQ